MIWRSLTPYAFQFAEQEKCTALVRFWLATEHFYQSLINRMIDNQTLTENALNIYDQYVRLEHRQRHRLSVKLA